MVVATGLYLVALLLITLFTDAIFGVNAQSLAYAPLALCLMVLVYLALVRGPRDFIQRWWTSSPMMAAGLLFLGGLAASMPNAHELGLAGKDFLRWSFVWLVYAPVTRAICDRPGRCALFARAAAVFVAGFAGLAVGDLFTGGALTRSAVGRAAMTYEGRYQSLYENPGIFAGMLIVGFPLAVTPALTERGARRRAAWLLGLAVILTGMLLSGSRAALVTAVVTTVVVATALRRWWLLGLTGAVVIGISVLLSTGTLEGPPSLVRFQQGLVGSGTGTRSLQRRMLIWSVAGELIQRRPVVGWGGAQLRYHQHGGFKRAHNAWLDAWLDGGLLAALAMLIVAAAVVRRAWLTLRGEHEHWVRPTHVALVGACLAVLAGWMVRAGIGSRIDWLPIFMLFGLNWEHCGSGACEARRDARVGGKDKDGAA